MRFLADMGIASSCVAYLVKHGHDAIHLRAEGLQCLDDQRIVAKALRERRVILTHDLDFCRIVALSGSALPSVVTFRLANMKPDNVNRFLAEILERFHENLERGAIISVTELALRVRDLPLDHPHRSENAEHGGRQRPPG